jgi:hypothetical protein
MLAGSGSTNNVLRWLTSLDEVAGEMRCRNCYPRAGSGVFEEPAGLTLSCVTCKGSGLVLVSL